ncbi:MAG: hypothetical protein ABFD53_13225 [Anaerolineaceae bacterium]
MSQKNTSRGKLWRKFIAFVFIMFSIAACEFNRTSFATTKDVEEDIIDSSDTYAQLTVDNEYFTYLPIIRASKEENILGMQMGYISYSSGLSQLASTQSYWVGGAPILWSEIEKTKGNYDWSAAESSAIQWQSASSEGFYPIGNVRSTPTWAQLRPGYYCGPMKEQYFKDFAEFMRQVVSRYSVPPYNVKYWEIWNEPDVDYRLVGGDSQFGCLGNSDDKKYYGGGYYAKMLKAVYPAIKSANPNAQVLVGGLLLDCNPNKPGIDCISSRFFEGIVANGGGPYFDGVSYHAYNYFSYTWGLPEGDRYSQNLGHYKSNDKWNSQWNTTGPVLIEKAGYLNGILSKYGVSGKYLLNTEDALNCSVCSGEIVDPYNENPTPAFETTKAYYIVQANAAARNLGLKANLWYSLLGWPEKNTGLLNADLSEREGFVAYRVASEKLSGVENLGVITSSDINPITGISGYKFIRKNRQVWVVWSLDGNNHDVTLHSSKQLAAITDALGVAQPLSTSCTITIKPLYIEWIP